MSAIAWLSKKLDDGRIICEACKHECTLKEGEYGICAIRKVENGVLNLLTYGLAAAVHINRIEKQPVFHLMPGSRVLSIGTIGCNFSCKFCENYDFSQYPKENDYKIDGRKLSPQEAVDLALAYECESIAYTYNEPATYFEYCYDTAKLAHEAGLKNIYATSGYETAVAIDLIAPFVDIMVIDIKSSNDTFYNDLCGASLQPVLDTIRYAHSKGIRIEATTPLIPEHNDSDEAIRAIGTFIADLDPSIPWHLMPFKPMYKMLNIGQTPAETLRRAYDIGKKTGLHYVYIKNPEAEGCDTASCHGCA